MAVYLVQFVDEEAIAIGFATAEGAVEAVCRERPALGSPLHVEVVTQSCVIYRDLEPPFDYEG